ncbi:archease family protein [Toxoplasma gondii VAND]|uniref:Protein archease-like n=1 Tax=Toxoplasma gondii VAND TaxID=933077 RepID=A0A086PGY0_TOXGO|nr:archease family protein [Toxoplasma gondii VAND]
MEENVSGSEASAKADPPVIEVAGVSVRSLPPRPHTRKHHRQPVDLDGCFSNTDTHTVPFSSSRDRETQNPAHTAVSLAKPPAPFEHSPCRPTDQPRSCVEPSDSLASTVESGEKSTEGRQNAGIPAPAADTDRRCGFEYLDHTADVIIHAWGSSLGEAFERAGQALFHYMTDTGRVEARERRTIDVSGRDLEDLLFHFLDELLFLYGSDYFVARKVSVTELDSANGRLVCEVAGERFDRTKHSQGTEVKAITMHEMKIWRKPQREALGSEGGAETDRETRGEKPVEVFVLVDI